MLLPFLLILLLPRSQAFRLGKENKASKLGLKDNEYKNMRCPTALNVGKRFKNFEQVLDTFREKPLVIYFSTKTCGPCKLMEQELKTARKMLGDEMKFFALDTEKWPSVGSRFAVSRLPCLVVFCEGEIKLKMEGVNSAQAVVEQVRVHLPQPH